jgi:hypothetical protein
MKSCTESHETCETPGAGGNRELPYRLLQIDPSDHGVAYLVETPFLDEDQKTRIHATGFATLSYCWGGDQTEKLTTANRSSRMTGVPVQRFAKTLQDALWFTAQIGLEFIWIDALCILQDDDDDKAREIAKMAMYYNTSKVTLCAASASSSSEGFLSKRSEREYGAGPFRVPFQSGGTAGSVLLYEEPGIPEFDEGIPAEPLASRAWTLQESMLSRRMVIFSSSQIYWTCCQANASCGGVNNQLFDRIMGHPRSLVTGIFPIESMWSLPIVNIWHVSLMDYTTRNLSFPGDKLLAISALASYLHQTVKDRHGETVYLAGLFLTLKAPAEAALALAWFTDYTVAQRAAVYRAPSWSWACLDGPLL